MSELPFVSVIVPHYSDLHGLRLCLDALERQTYPRNRFEIIVADNNSPQGEAAVSGVLGGRGKLVAVSERGAGPARNGGVAASHGDILAFTDSDCVPEPEWMHEGILALTRYDFVGGRVKVLVDDPRHMTDAEAFERVFAFDFKSYILRKGFTGSGNLFCSRRVFDTVGGFRVGVSEDVDWSHRARAAGFKLGYAPTAVVGHPARRTWEELTTKWRRVNAESFGLAVARRHGRFRWLLRSLVMPASAIAHSPRVLSSPELVSTADRFAALRVLFRLRLWRCLDSLKLLAASGRA